MMSTIDEKERNVVYYPVDLKFITDLAADFSNTADGLGQVWYKISQTEVEKIIHSALKVNYILNHRNILLIYGKYVPSMDLINIFKDCVMIPRFIRDVIREIIRPMHHSGITYIPDIDVHEKPFINILDLFDTISSSLTKWHNVCQKLGFELVPILPEAVQSVSLTFYTYETDEILAFDNLMGLDWRLESFGRTKHLVYNPLSEVVELDKSQVTTSRKRAQEKEHIPQETLQVYERPIENRRILGMLVFRYTCSSYIFRMGYIPSSYRFPTEERHSLTPPSSNRALLSEQTMVRSVRKKSKPERVKIVTMESSTDRSH